jgi:Bacterial Ig-like domain (group 3)/FG-GAP-like repeat
LNRLVVTVALALIAASAHAACVTPVLTQQTPFAVGTDPRHLVLEDFNKDGKPDLATPQTTSGAGFLFQLGNGDGTFAPAVEYGNGDFTLRLQAADFNGDGWLDILSVNNGEFANHLTVNLNDQNGGFVDEPIVVYTLAQPIKAHVGDANSDGKLDVVVTSFGAQAVRVHYGNGDGTFAQTTTTITIPQYQVTDAALGDMNADQRTDVVVYRQSNTPGTPGEVAIYHRLADGNYSTTPELHPFQSASTGSLWLRDLNGDGDLDIIATTSYGFIRVFNRNDNGTFRPDNYNISNYSLTMGDIAYGDVTEDGLGDLVFGPDNTPVLVVYPGLQDGWFRDPPSVIDVTPEQNRQFPGMGIGDINSDGRPDVVALSMSEAKVYPFLSNCVPQFTSTALTTSPNPSIANDPVQLVATVSTRGGTAQPTGTVSFYEGDVLLGTSPLSGSVATLTITPGVGSHGYRAVYNGDSTFAVSGTSDYVHVVQLPPFGTPAGFMAFGDSATGQVQMGWQPMHGVTHYEISRMSGGTWTVVGTTAENVFFDSIGTGNSAFYRVRAFNAEGAASGYAVAASTMAASFPQPGSIIGAADITALRAIINSLRAAAGLTPFSFTDPSLTGVPIKALHITQLRTAFEPAAMAAGLPAPAWSRPIVPGLTVLANDLLEVHAKVR